MVRVFIDGQFVPDEELENYEIKNELAKRIFAEAARRKITKEMKEEPPAVDKSSRDSRL